MSTLHNKILPSNLKKRKVVSILYSIIVSGLLTVWGIFGIGEYGIALFILTPLLLGAMPVVLYGYDQNLSIRHCIEIGILTLVIFSALLLICAIEGAICIVMAAPIGGLFTVIGSLIGYALIKKISKKSAAVIIVTILSIPSLSFIEKNREPQLLFVVTSVEINADAETVWKNVIEFPELNEPTALLFKTGIAYPTDATIDGKGVGAIRHCNFTTGSFIEPITVWDEPNLLQFDVKDQPVPMKELNFWNIDAPHLHDYFISKRGQFKLIQLPGGRTLLEGTTWYYNKIKPGFYWNIWSDYIIHKIHNRVLEHIKLNSESNKAI